MTQKEFIRMLMKRKGIESDQELLYKILKYLKNHGYKTKSLDSEKGNFSHMLNGDRNFTYYYIIALEEILDISFSNIINQIDISTYTPRGLRYITSLNNYQLFKKLAEEGKILNIDIIKNTDEYNKSIIDYIIEFKAIKGIKYLKEERGLIYNDSKGYLELDKKPFYDNIDQIAEVGALLIENNELELFNNIFDGYEILKYYNDHKSVFTCERLIIAILNNSILLNELIDVKLIELSKVYGNKNYQEQMYFLNPLVNIIYSYALHNSNIYLEQVINILEKCLEKNEIILTYFKNKYPSLKDICVKSNGYISSTYREKIYGLIFIPLEANKETTKEVKNLMEKNTDLINEYLFKKDTKDELLNEDRIIDFIMTSSGISYRFRDNEEVLNIITQIINRFKCTKDFKENLVERIKQYLDKKLNNLNKDSESYHLEYENIEWCRIFVELYKDKLNNIE